MTALGGTTRGGDAALVDPCGASAGPPAEPANRGLILGGSKALLIDNGKLSPQYGAYAAVFDGLKAVIPEPMWSIASHDLLRIGEDEIGDLARDLIIQHAPAFAVLALADAGITVQTVLLAIALERGGIPTVVIGTPLGARVGHAIYAAHAPALKMVVLDTVRTDGAADILRFVKDQAGAIRRALTEVPPAIGRPNGLLFPTEAVAWAAAAPAIERFQDWAERAQIGDGLPLVPPTAEAVARLLATIDADPDDVIYGAALTSGRRLRVRDAAANAVMAGCLPQAFPVVIAALRAMAQPAYRLSQAAITTHPSGNAVILAGTEPERFGLSGGPGCLGPGHRGNACAGRAVSLAVQSLFGARPGGADLTMFGSAAEFTYCFAEATAGNPWPSLSTELGDGRPGVFVLKAEAPRNLLEHLAMTPEGLCAAFAGAAVSVCSNNTYIPGDLLVLINPEHAAIFAKAGWSRSDIALALYNLARIPLRATEGRGIAPIRPAYMAALEDLPVTRSPSDVHIIVAGAPGPQSMVALPWGYSRGCWQNL